jgi:hypothetical protein
MISVNVEHYIELANKAERAEEYRDEAAHNYELLRAERRKNTRLRWRLEQIREALEEVTQP